jgi:hypothetical protein
VRAYDVALFVDRLVVEPAGTPNTGDLSATGTAAAQWIGAKPESTARMMVEAPALPV